MSAQLEDGYTRTANELIEFLMKTRFNGTQHSIIYCVIRNTYGFQRKCHELSLTYISTATGIHKDLIKRELNKLIEFNVITVFREANFRTSRVIGMNKNTVDWEVHSESKSTQGTKQSTLDLIVGEQGTKQSTPTGDELVHQERKIFKEIKEIQEEEDTPMTAMDAYRFSFKKISYTGHIAGYVSELMQKGFTDAFIRELFLEMGEHGANPSIHYMKKVADDWIANGIYTRVAAKKRHEQKLSNTSISTKPKKYSNDGEKKPREVEEE